MPPFGFDNDRLGLMLKGSGLSDLINEMDSHGAKGVVAEALTVKSLSQQCHNKNIPVEVACALQELFAKATQLGEKVRRAMSRHVVMSMAVDGSIRIVLTEVLDQVTTLLEMDSNKSRVVEALTKYSIEHAFRLFQRLETKVFEADISKLEPFLREFGEKSQDHRPPIRVSLLSHSLAFEFMAGEGDTMEKSSCEIDDHVGLRINATPYLLVQSSEITENNCLLNKHKNCTIQIDHCSQKKLFTKSGSGVTGEAIVRLYLNPGQVLKKAPKEGKVWSRCCDSDRLSIAEVRAVQTNAYPRTVQTRLDLYCSSMHGLGGFFVTITMKTYQSVNNECPDFDIELVMRPPSN